MGQMPITEGGRNSQRVTILAKGQDDESSVKLSDYFQVGQDAAQTQCSG